MRMQRVGGAVVAALIIAAVLAGSASATSVGIKIIEPQLTNQRGVLRFREPLGGEIICATTLTKTLITEELIAVRPELTKLGKITSGRMLECPAAFLNLPPILGGIPGPGPNPGSWDVFFLSSNLPGGELNFGILDFQVRITLGGVVCLYRGILLGTLSTEGTILRYNRVIPLFAGVGCPEAITVEGLFANEPAIRYALLSV